MSWAWHAHFRRALNRGSFIAAHAGVTLILILVIGIIQKVVIVAGDPKLFDWVPVRYIFDVMEAVILLQFVVFGTIEAVQVFREGD